MIKEKKSEEITNEVKPISNWLILLVGPYLLLALMWFFFPVAGDWAWIEAWVYLGSWAIIFTIAYMLINRKDSTVIRNRAKVKKTGVTNEIKKEAGSDRWIYPLMTSLFFGAWILAGLNKRNGWTTVPFYLVIVGHVLNILGIIILNLSTYHNAFASKILDINEGQKLIDTGMYAHIRHPLYAGVWIMLIGTPFALGSWFALIPAVLCMGLFLIRIKYEEEMLIKGIEGYEDYRKKVKYKLIPKIL